MTLKITRGTDPIEITTITILLYGVPGVGKSSLAFSAEDVLLLDFDQGMHRSGFRGDGVRVGRWADIAAMDAADFAGYKTVAVDTVGRCLDLLSLDLVKSKPNLENDATGGLTRSGYGALKAGFAAWLGELRSYGLDVVLTAHAKEDRDGDNVVFRPDITGGSYSEIFKLADGVAWYVAGKDSRTLGWDPTDRYVGKNPGAFAPCSVPDLTEEPDYLAQLVTSIKGRIGKMSERAAAVRTVAEEFRGKVKDAKSASALTKLVAAGQEIEDPAARRQAKGMIVQKARDMDLRWDTEKEKFAKNPKEEEG